MAGTPRSRQWADLPLELAGLVLGRLPTHVDRVRFGAVCPQWRSAAGQVQLPPPPPLLSTRPLPPLRPEQEEHAAGWPGPTASPFPLGFRY
ncbi:unnamed protein product [Urochloa humidicola]